MDAAAPRKRFDLVAYLKLFRFPLVFTAIADSAAGYLMGEPGLDPVVLGSLALSSAGLYFFGMALNDIADREKDKVGAPGRVLPSKRLSLRQAKWAALLALMISFSAILGPGYRFLVQRLVVWALIAGCICAYNLFLKLPPVMGLVRAFNLLLGVSALTSMGPEGPERLWIFGVIALPTFIYISALTYVSTLEDSGPRRGRILLGAGFMALGALMASLIIPILVAGDFFSGAPGYKDVHDMVSQVMRRWQGFLFSTVLVGWIFRRAWNARDQKGIMLIVRDGIGGIILLDAALVATLGSLKLALGVAALVIPAVISVAIFKKLA